MNWWQRVLIVTVCVLALGGLSVHYEMADVDRGPYPAVDSVGENYQTHVGEEVVLYGTVLRQTDDALHIDVSAQLDDVRVTGFSGTVEPGGVVAVYGTLQEGHAIAAANVVVVNQGPGAFTYKYAVSGIGAVLILALFLRSWRLSLATLTFERRGRDDG